MADATRIPVAFCRALRTAGLAVSVADTVDYARALTALGLTQRNRLYWAGRATLVRDPEHVGTYDATFADFFDGVTSHGLASEASTSLIIAHDAPTEAEPDEPRPPDSERHPTAPVLAVRWSRAEVLADRDFASLSAEEFDEARRLIGELKFDGPTRRSRRHRPSRRRNRLDVRATVRAAARHGGELVRPAYRAPIRKPRRVVILCDVSGSMEPYTRALLRFVQATVVARRSVEVFTLGTRLTRITAALDSRDPDAALVAVTARVPDLGGGTRLGEMFRAFNDQWGIQGTARGAIVVIVSDGWDRGEPDVVGREMARLRRVAHRIVWVNPLKAGEGYAPLARGMAAALPSIDDFVAGHSLASLRDLADIIQGAGR